MMRRLLIFIPLIVFIGLAWLLWRGLGTDPSKLPSALVGKAFPAFQLPSLLEPSKTLTVEQLKGKPVLVNVFASWCPTCFAEHPYLIELAQKQNVIIYGINYKDDREDALRYLQRLGNPYREIIYDQDGHLGVDLGVYGTPETFVIDATGKILYRHVGEINEQVWREILQPKLADKNTL